jgi:hypothetical protein
MSKSNYTPERCEHCGQTKTYLLAIDPGTADIVRAISAAIRQKRENEIHPRKEMEVEGWSDYQDMIRLGHMTSNMVGNLSRARFHGLIARIKGRAGWYCMTTKGAKFLRGATVHRFAIVDKTTGHQVGYWGDEVISIQQLRGVAEYWEKIDYFIEDGQIVFDQPVQKTLNL